MTYFEPETFGVQNAGNAWSYRNDGNAMRFELHPGDHWRKDRDGVERSEVSSSKALEFNKTYTVNYKFMIEPGQANTADWLVLGQFHAEEDEGDQGVSPPFEINFEGERMQVDVRWSTPELTNWSNVETETLYTDANDIERGKWYEIKMEVKFDPFGGGVLNVWRDGVQLVDYDGPLGYNDKIGPHWKQGIYREDSSEVIAVNYKDFSLNPGTEPGEGAPPPTEEVPPPVAVEPIQGTGDDDFLAGTSGADSILGASGDDALHGKDGNDFLSGEDGNDILHGGAGDDVLHGLVGRDFLYGGAGNDRLVTGKGQNVVTGGSGADVFDFNALDEQTLGTSWITDFKHGIDKIDLFDIDADATMRGNQAFTFIGQDVFSGKAGEVRYSGNTLSADVDGDKVGDFHVKTLFAKLSAGDFVL